MLPRSTMALGALLLASLALNVRLYEHKPTAPSVAPRPTGAEGRDDCEHRLALCQRRGFDALRRVIPAESTSPKPAPTPTAPSAPGAGDAEQDSALCEAAKRELRDRWQRERDEVAASIAKSASDADQQERDMTSVLGKMRGVAGLDEGQADLVARAYQERWVARWDEARGALLRDPQDFGGLADAARGLFADEDAILERIAGPAARDAWRADQLVVRTEVVAVTSAMADRALDASLHW